MTLKPSLPPLVGCPPGLSCSQMLWALGNSPGQLNDRRLGRKAACPYSEDPVDTGRCEPAEKAGRSGLSPLKGPRCSGRRGGCGTRI